MKLGVRYIVALLVLYSTTAAQKFPVNTLVDNGPRDKRVNIVFLGDGYQITEMQKFNNDVAKTVNYIFNEKPFAEYKNLFNVFSIEVPSVETGTSHSGTASDCGSLKEQVFTKNTYFKTTFDFGGIHRLLVAQNGGAALNILQDNLPEYDMVFMIVNHDWYGGSGGGTFSVFSTNVNSSEIAIHESGHSFAHLNDEYGGSSQNKYDGHNVTYRTERNLIPWNHWILLSTPLPTPQNQNFSNVVGLFEGAYYSNTGMYRPKLNCKMRELSVPFCEVCTEQYVRSIFSYLEVAESYLPEQANQIMFVNQKREFKINLLPIDLKSVSVNWILNGTTVSNAASYILDASTLSIGKHQLSAFVEHTTDYVRKDPNKFLQSIVTWTIDVKSATSVEDGNLPFEFELYQNYPNPFNPTTTISYQIPEAGNVSLKVYDLFGRVVATLIDEFKTPGIYNSEFSILNSKLSSGIYFYTLNSGKYKQTKKLSVIK